LVQGPQEQLLAKQVVVTAPAPVAAALCVDLTAEERGLLAGVEYQGIVCASLLLKERLAPYYITNITDHVPFTAVIEMTALVDPAELGGNHLVYLPRYLPLDSPLWNETDDTFREQFLAALERIYPHFQRDQVLAFRISRARHVLPIPTLHYSQRLPPRITSVPGLFLVNSAHIVNGTLNVNETLRLADDSLAWLPAQAERADEGEHPGRACHVTAAG
jgi:protoporphyrinogen oxidase